MNIIVIKSLLGTIMGRTEMKFPLEERLHIQDPVDIQMIVAPTQSKIGGQMIMSIQTNLIALPTKHIDLVLSQPYYFFYPATDNPLIDQYLQTLKRANEILKKAFDN